MPLTAIGLSQYPGNSKKDKKKPANAQKIRAEMTAKIQTLFISDKFTGNVPGNKLTWSKKRLSVVNTYQCDGNIASFKIREKNHILTPA